MKLHADSLQGVNAISAYDAASVTINGTVWRGSVIVPHRGPVLAWDCPGAELLRPEHFAPLVELQPELVVFGSGRTLKFAPPAALRELMARRIGIETMDTGAACRTYAVLAGEGRRVAAALILQVPPAAAG